jgi:hypothetical protein
MYTKNTKPTADQIAEMQKFYNENNVPVSEVGKKFGWHRHTLAKYLIIKNRTLDEDDRIKRRIKAVVDWRKRTKIRLVEYKGGKCECCGYNKCIEALQFHHLDPSKKDFAISGVSRSFDSMKNEVDKCKMLCANCHIETHATERK